MAASTLKAPVHSTFHQGLTLVHVSAQRKCFLWDRGCIQRLLGGIRGIAGCVCRVYFVSKTAQVELISEEV